MPSIIFLIILAILGIVNTAYLIIKRVKKKSLVCFIGSNCNTVIKSKYSKIFFINNDVLGFIYYLLLITFALYFIFISKKILFLMQIISGIAVIASLLLFYIQARILKKYCSYCNISNLLNILIFLIVMNLFFNIIF